MLSSPATSHSALKTADLKLFGRYRLKPISIFILCVSAPLIPSQPGSVTLRAFRLSSALPSLRLREFLY